MDKFHHIHGNSDLLQVIDDENENELSVRWNYESAAEWWLYLSLFDSNGFLSLGYFNKHSLKREFSFTAQPDMHYTVIGTFGLGAENRTRVITLTPTPVSGPDFIKIIAQSPESFIDGNEFDGMWWIDRWTNKNDYDYDPCDAWNSPNHPRTPIDRSQCFSPNHE